MPNIPGYEAPQNLGLNPTEIGADATAAAARRINSAYNQAGQGIENTGARLGSAIGGAISTAGKAYVDYEDHKEISHGAAVGADLVDQLNKDWDKTLKSNPDPNDQSVAGKWREENLEPALEQFSAGFTTEKSQAWAQSFIDRYRDHAFQKTAADMGSRAKDAAIVNGETTNNKLSSAVYNDPSTLDFALDTLKHSVAGIAGSANLTPDVSSRVSSELNQKGQELLVKSAVAGSIARGGDWQRIANNPKYSGLINATELQTFARAAKTQERADLLQQKQLQIADRQLQEQKVHQGANDVMNNRVSIDPATGRPIIDPKFFSDALDLARKNPGAPNAAETVRTLINWGEAKQNEKAAPATDDATTKTALNASLYDPGTSMSDARVKIMQAEIDRKLTPQTANTMRQLTTELESGPIKEPIYGKTMVDVSRVLGGDEVGKEHFANFQLDFMSQYLAAKRTGNAPANALDVNDPKSMISQAMKPYMRTPAQMMMDRAAHGDSSAFGDITGISVTNAPPRPPGGIVNVPPTFKTNDEIKAWAKQQNYPSGTKLKRADGSIGTVP